MARRGGVGFDSADPFAAPRSGDAGGPHVPGDLIPSDVVASTAGGFPQLAGTVDTSRLLALCQRQVAPANRDMVYRMSG